MITQEQLKQHLLYDEETGIFVRLIGNGPAKVGDVAGYLNSKGYIAIRVMGKMYTAHRLAWLYVNGDIPAEIDHINGVRHDNRIVNLRSVNRKQNMENSKLSKSNLSGFKGVSFHKRFKKWRAQIRHNGVKIHLGYFDLASDAGIAYSTAARLLFTHHREVLEP